MSAKMKFRQRAIVIASAFVILTFVAINMFIFGDSHDSNDPLRESLSKKDSRLFGHDSVRGHLNIMRKDLDKSNFSSTEENAHALSRNGKLESISSGRHRAYFKFVANTPRDIPNKDFFEKLEENDRLRERGDDVVIELKIDEHFYNYQQMTVEGIRKKIATFRKKARSRGKKLNILSAESITKDMTSWEKFYMGISQYEIYQEGDPTIDQLIEDMATLPIIDAVQKKGGTQIKLIISFNNDGQALFKPQRHGRDYVTNPNHFYFSDFERHTSEIASFHLDRTLGFRWVPPVAGRLVNSSHEIQRVCDSKLLKTFFISPAGNLCFYGKCSYYCDSGHAVCAKRDMLEGSLMAFLPPDSVVSRSEWENPWRRSYSKWKKAEWEVDPEYCRKFVLTDDLYRLNSKSKRKRLLDVLDMTIFDFFTGNMDRHHYNTFEMFDNETIPFLWDNGRGFGKPDQDEMSIIVPLVQCCIIRHSTLQKLVVLHNGPVPLSVLMRTSLKRDKLDVDPILPENHMKALDRRVGLTLKVVHDCILERGFKKVVIDDGF